MHGSTGPVTERRALSAIAYGFIASKALFAALEIDLFTRLADGPRTATELMALTGIAPNRLRTLLHALTGLGLLVVDGPGYANAPASQRWLVRGAPAGFGEYFRLQVGRQIYPALAHLDDGIAGTAAAFDSVAGLLSSPAEARAFTDAQHAGSIGAARKLAGRIGLSGATRLLDVGGGSGAFAIALCERAPALRATLLDLPPVVDIARQYRDEAGLAGRIDLLAGDNVHTPWPQGQDVVLLSYLLSALGDAEIDAVLGKAHGSLAPDGLLVVHDFMLDDDGPGPLSASLWFLQYLAYRADTVSFSAVALADRVRGHGFGPASCQVLIPDITKVILTRKVAQP